MAGRHRVKVIHTRVFAAEPGGGNPCPVVLVSDGLTDDAMQSIARRFGLDTAFIATSPGGGHLRVRFFVPDHELGVSGHATIAAVTVALAEGVTRPGVVEVETLNGTFRTLVDNREHERSPIVVLEQNLPTFGATVEPRLVARVLGTPVAEIEHLRSPIQSVSVSRPKLLVPLMDYKALDDLKPDYPALWDLCEQLEVSGLYPFTRITDKRGASIEARQFPLRAGFDEDAATGVAACALGAYLCEWDMRNSSGEHEFIVAQGYHIGRPSRITVRASCNGKSVIRTSIAGTAELTGVEWIEI